jgi:WD40 repeat protein
VDEIVGVQAAASPGYPPLSLLGNPRVKVWSLTGTLFQIVPTVASDVAISPDGQFLAIADTENNVKVFRISDGSLVNTHHYGGSVF